MTGTSTESVEH